MRLSIISTLSVALLGVSQAHHIARRQVTTIDALTNGTANTTIIEDEHLPSLVKPCDCPPDNCPPFLNSKSVSRLVCVDRLVDEAS